jgi:plastocyanin
MKKTFTLIALLFIALQSSFSATHSITSNNFNFSPSTVTIAPGDVVAFTNGAGFHNVEWLSGPAGFTLPAVSSILNATPVNYTLTIPGEYTYQCGVHGATMLGSITVSAVLPIRLYSFTVSQHQDGLQLQWATSTEQNVSVFEIEQADDKLKFSKIAQIAAVGNSAELQQYHLHQPLHSNAHGVQYFRLKTIDTNGSYEYSAIVSLLVMGDSQWRLFPNPTQKIFSFTWANEHAELLDMAIYNTTGQQLMRKANIPNDHHQANAFDVDVSGFKYGRYVVVLSSGSKTVKQFSFLKN